MVTSFDKRLQSDVYNYLLKLKRCNYPNSLTDKEKAIISDGLSSVAPLTGQLSNQIITEMLKINELRRIFPIEYILSLRSSAC